jgi:Uma2 family endonuclease
LFKIQKMRNVIATSMTEEEYLAFEETSEVRHEFIHGKLYEMPGTTDFHNEICQQLAYLLKFLLKIKGFKIYQEAIKLRISDKKYTYPDVFVTNDASDLASRQIKRYPTLIVEVLSDSTRVYDKTDKFILYQQIPTLKYYLTVEPEKPLVECYALQDDGTWEVETFTTLAEVIKLPFLNMELPMSEIYE